MVLRARAGTSGSGRSIAAPGTSRPESDVLIASGCGENASTHEAWVGWAWVADWAADWAADEVPEKPADTMSNFGCRSVMVDWGRAASEAFVAGCALAETAAETVFRP